MLQLLMSDAGTIVLPWWFAVSALLTSAVAGVAGSIASQKIASTAALQRERESAARAEAVAQRELFRSDKLVLLGELLAVIDEQIGKEEEFLRLLNNRTVGPNAVNGYVLSQEMRRIAARGNLLVPELAAIFNELVRCQNAFAAGIRNDDLNASRTAISQLRSARIQFINGARKSLGVTKKQQNE